MVSEVTTNSLLISWNSPVFNGFSPLEEFRADITGTGVDDFELPANDLDAQLPVTGLQPFTFYIIQLVAINEVGLVSQPAEVTVTTVSLGKYNYILHFSCVREKVGCGERWRDKE